MTRDETLVQGENAAFSSEHFESGLVSVDPGWLKEVWNKWPGDETIEELLAALEDGDKA